MCTPRRNYNFAKQDARALTIAYSILDDNVFVVLLSYIIIVEKVEKREDKHKKDWN